MESQSPECTLSASKSLCVCITSRHQSFHQVGVEKKKIYSPINRDSESYRYSDPFGRCSEKYTHEKLDKKTLNYAASVSLGRN